MFCCFLREIALATDQTVVLMGHHLEKASPKGKELKNDELDAEDTKSHKQSIYCSLIFSSQLKINHYNLTILYENELLLMFP